MDDLDAQELKLPKWARDRIEYLRKQVRYSVEQSAAELAKLRPQVELLKTRNEAMTELIECAARGGHKTAQEIVQIIEAYGLELVKKQ